MLPLGMECIAEVGLMVVWGYQEQILFWQYLKRGGGIDFFPYDRRQCDSWNVSVWKREIGHSGIRVFTKARIGCGTYNIQTNKNSPRAISRLDDSGHSIMRTEIWVYFGEAIFSELICISEEFDMRNFKHKVKQLFICACLNLPANTTAGKMFACICLFI